MNSHRFMQAVRERAGNGNQSSGPQTKRRRKTPTGAHQTATTKHGHMTSCQVGVYSLNIVRYYQATRPKPATHAKHLCEYHEADPATISAAIDGALAAKASWEALPWADRAAIFLKAADLVSGKYRYKLMAATMLGQGKNAWQAEIDAAAEVRDNTSR